jgi:hypothetical protein
MRHSITLAVITGVLTCGYTDKPIPGAVRVASTAPRPAAATARNYASQQATTNQQLAASNDRIATTQNDARVAGNVAKDLEASRIERCKKARSDYNTSINSLRLYNLDQNGNRVYLTDAELAQRRIDSAKAVESICGPQG